MGHSSAHRENRIFGVRLCAFCLMCAIWALRGIHDGSEASNTARKRDGIAFVKQNVGDS